jgi:hypothetical protein
VAIQNFIFDDPFLGIRTVLRSQYPDSDGEIHDMPLGDPTGATASKRGLAGFTAYLDDQYVPGTTENEEWQASNAKLSALLGFDDLPPAEAKK